MIEASPPQALVIDNVTKTFPGVRALDGVSIELRAGEIHALLGQNGAGKTTLMHILAGVLRPDSGRIVVDGRAVNIRNPSDGQRLGISIVHQELSLFPSRTVAENILVGRLPVNRLGLVDDAALHARARELLDALEAAVSSRELIRNLGFSYCQLIEIVKALSFGGKVLILDEPTSALSEHETAILLRHLDKLRSSGMGIIYVSHRLPEVFAISDRITVLRDGRVAGSFRTAEADPDTVISTMVQRTVADVRTGQTSRGAATLLSVRGLTVPKRVHAVDFEVKAGEIVGLTGLAGAGQEEAGRAIAGLTEYRAAQVTLGDKPLRARTPRGAMRQGVVYLPADRRVEGLFLRLSVQGNIVAASLKKHRWGPWMLDAKARSTSYRFVKSLGIRTPSVDQEVVNLSGGNQQKVVLARALTVDARLFVADEPTRGIDVGAKNEVYELLRRLANNGKSILLVSTELREVLSMSDRIVVFHDGRIVGEVRREDATEERIMAMASGHTGAVH
jgi:ribose transport system ATP-binding protein